MILVVDLSGAVSVAIAAAQQVRRVISILVWVALLGGVKQAAVREDVVPLKQHVGPHLDDVLDEPPDDAVCPDEQWHQLVLVSLVLSNSVRLVPETTSVDVIWA